LEFSIPLANAKTAQQKVFELRYEALRLKNPEIFS